MPKAGWSFCIVTAPNNEKILERAIEKIQNEFQGVDNYEIIVVGGTQESHGNIRFIPFQEEIFSPSFKNVKVAVKKARLKNLFYKSGAISHKKNLAARLATYDKLCVMHDYVGIEIGWLKGFNNFGLDWDVCVTPVLDVQGKRHRDWMSWDYPGIGPGLLPYHAYTKYMYISGAYFCVKKEFFLMYPLDEKLFWGEGEDVEWSLRVREKTKFSLNIASPVKYLKAKPVDDCPNCPSWKVSTEKLISLFPEEK